MGRGAVEFVGRWPGAERNLVEMSVSASEQFLGVRPPRPWVFEKADGGGYSATQPEVFGGKLTAAKLPDLLEKLRRAVARASEAPE